MVLLVLGSQITKSQATSIDCCSVNYLVFIFAFVDRLITMSSVSATESSISSQLKCWRCDNIIWLVGGTVFCFLCTCLLLSNLISWRNVNFQMSPPDGDVSPNTSCNKESLICLLTPLTFSSLRESDKKLAISSPFQFHLKSLPMLKAP